MTEFNTDNSTTKVTSARPKRRKPRTARERLAETLRRSDELREQVDAERTKDCVGIVEALLKEHGLKPIDGDFGDGERLARLRETLGLPPAA